MALTKRNRARGLRRAQAALGQDLVVQCYAVGVVGPSPRRTRLLITLGAILVAVIFELTLKVMVIPGILVLAVIYVAIDRPIAVARTEKALVILHRNEITGRPSGTWFALDPDALGGPNAEVTRGYVHVPSSRLWLSTREATAVS